MPLDPFAPLRLGVRAGIGLLRFELRVIEHLLGLDREDPEPVHVWPEPPLAAEREREWMASGPEPIAPPGPAEPIRIQPEPRAALEPEEPEHLDDEPELVAEFADAGAEDGAGAEVRINEPWHGYRRMRVADVRDRVAVANPAELAVIQLYESANRGRRSILDAVQQRTRVLANAPR